jgi:fumarate reductase flavoprotein subunit
MNDITEAHDVVVIGGGIAGLVAANRAAEMGLDVVVLEKSREEKYLCNSRYTGGTFHISYNDVAKPAEALRQAIESATAGFARKDLAAAIATDGIRLVRWLQKEGIKFLNLGQYHTFVLAPPSRTAPGLEWEGRGGDVLLRTLESNLVRRGGRLLRGFHARRLDVASGAGIRVEADGAHDPRVFAGSAVIIADGGFSSDLDLIRSNITPHAEKLQQRNAGTSSGDGLRMAQAIGAAVVGMDCFYGHLLSRDAMSNAMLWPRPYVDALAVAGILVDQSGRRFADEGEGGVFLANAVARLDDPLSATLVFDHAVWDGPGRSPLIPANPHLPNAGGTLHVAQSIGELASLMGVAQARLQETVAAYNAALRSGSLGELSPPRRGDKHKPWPIERAPYYGLPVCAGITNTMGGIAVDADGSVLDESGAPLPGLYAVGATTGGLEGGPEIGYVGGLIKAVLGLRAAERIAQLREQKSIA